MPTMHRRLANRCDDTCASCLGWMPLAALVVAIVRTTRIRTINSSNILPLRIIVVTTTITAMITGMSFSFHGIPLSMEVLATHCFSQMFLRFTGRHDQQASMYQALRSILMSATHVTVKAPQRRKQGCLVEPLLGILKSRG